MAASTGSLLRRLFRCVVALSVAGLAGCAVAPPPAPPPPRPPVVAQPPLAAPGQACLSGLRRARVTFEPMADFHNDKGCGIANPVKVSATSLTWNRPAVMTCDMASAVDGFETQAVQAVAQRVLGQAVRKVFHAGTYDCRTERNSNRRLSQHALGRAIDITGFETADGGVISVKTHWAAVGARGQFLHEVAREACNHFNVVLTPNHDADHYDHLHLDIGPSRLCGV